MSAPASMDAVRPDRLTLLAFAAVVMLGGGNAIAVKENVAELAPFWSGAVRFVAAGLLLVAFVALSRRPFPRGRSLGGALLYGGLAFAGAFGFVYPALRHVPAGTAMVLISLVPLLTFGLAILQRQEAFRWQGLLGALIAVAGVAVIVADQVNASVPLASLLAIVIGAVFVAEAGVIMKGVPRSDPFAMNGVAMLAGGSVLLVASVIGREAWAIPIQPATWVALAYLVVFGSIALFGLYLFALRRWTASAVSYSTLLMPLITLPLAAALIGERVSPYFLIGGAIALAGVFIGAFLKVRPHASSVTSVPECLPIDDCPEAEAA